MIITRIGTVCLGVLLVGSIAMPQNDHESAPAKVKPTPVKPQAEPGKPQPDPSAPPTAPAPGAHADTKAPGQDPAAPHDPTPGAPKREDPGPFNPLPGIGFDVPGEKPVMSPRYVVEIPPDLQSWETWWYYNRDAYLDVKRAVLRSPASDGSGFNGVPAPADPLGLAPGASTLAEFAAPALFSVLAEESNPDLLSSTLIALGRMNGVAPKRDGDASGARTGVAMPWDSELDARLAVFVAHTQLSVAESAVLALGLRANARSAMNLGGLMNDTAAGRALCGREAVPQRMRSFAAFALGIVAERTVSEDLRRYVVHTLETALTNSEPNARDLPVACVSALGLARLELRGVTLAEAATLPASSSREALCARLLAILLDDSRVSVVRAHVPAALSRLCENSDDDLRGACLHAVLAALARTDEKTEVKQGCVLALGRLAQPVDRPADRDARARLVSLAREGERPLRGLALIAAGEIGSRARTSEEFASAAELQHLLLGELEKGRSGAPGWAGLSLGVFGHASALVPAADGNLVLKSALESSGSTSDLAAYGLALGMRADRAAYDVLVERVLREGDDRARAAYALGLGFLGRAEAAAPLRSVIERTVYRPLILRDAVIASAMLGQKMTSVDLWSWFQGSKSLAVQTAIGDALGSIGDVRLVQPMSQWARAKGLNPVTKTCVVRALGRIADIHPLSWNASYMRDVNYFAPTETLTGALTGAGVSPGTGILDVR